MIVSRSDDLIEVRMTPEELGHLRITVSARDSGQHVAFWVERPEILDQLRRNADLMMRQLSDLGLGDASLEFRQDNHEAAEEFRARQTHRDHAAGRAELGAELSAADPLHPVIQALSSHRLDLRI